MKAASKALLFLFLGIALALPLCVAQKQGAEKALPAYDNATEVKLKGTIEEVKRVEEADGEATRVLLKTAAQVVEVYVAPSSFLRDLECVFAKGEEVEIIGSKVKSETAMSVLAREITRGQLTLTLRDKKGVPVWSGWKRS